MLVKGFQTPLMLGNVGAANRKGSRAEKYFAALIKEIRTSQMTKGEARYQARDMIRYWWETHGCYTE